MSGLACQEVRKRFDVFLDGELDGRTMRELALHVTRCDACETELREFEKVQEMFAQAIDEDIDRLNVATLWANVERRLERRPPSVWSRLQELWEEPWGRAVPVGGIAAAALAVAVLVASPWRSGEEGGIPPGELQAKSSNATGAEPSSNAARIERLESSANNVVVWSEPERKTTAIWVVDYSP